MTQPTMSQLTHTLTSGLALLLNTSTIDAAELLEMREMLEIPAAGLAAQRRTGTHLATLDLGLFDLDTDEVEDMLRKHRVFHSGIATASGNPLCELLSQPLYQIANERALVADAPREFWARVDVEHREILRCVTEGNTEGARRAAGAHVAYLRQAYLSERPVWLSRRLPGYGISP